MKNNIRSNKVRKRELSTKNLASLVKLCNAMVKEEGNENMSQPNI